MGCLRMRKILIKIIYSIECIHKNRYLHLDIKPGNILVFESDNNNGYCIEVKDNIKEILGIFENIFPIMELNKIKCKTPNLIQYLGCTIYVDKDIIIQLNNNLNVLKFNILLYILLLLEYCKKILIPTNKIKICLLIIPHICIIVFLEYCVL